ncbi:MAG: hypothetical protein IIB19_06200 [Chloroflexi bacterium]|nr:hypothetical protein [Chloroflexota bacterium]
MDGSETFEFAAAIAAISIGLAASFMLSLMAIIGSWRLFHHASAASMAATRAAQSIEELARRLVNQPLAEQSAEQGEFSDLRRQAEAMIEQQTRLQEMARNLFDTAALDGSPAHDDHDELASAVGRLDTTVGEMAASLANLIQLLERQQESR